MVDLAKTKRIHMIGIGGIGMSALARLYIHDKKQVSGSDQVVSPITCGLEALGAEVFVPQAAKNITDDIDCVVYTEAMSEDHEEMVVARKLGVPMMNYFEALGQAVNRYHLVAIAGTHGKTTTTAMLTDILEEASYDPTAIIGSLRSKTGSNFRAGKSKYAVVEACEYRRDFLHLEPDMLVITNIEAEHLDYYKDLADVQDAFRELALKVPEEGAVVANTADENIAPVLRGLKTKVIDYGKYFDPLLQLTQPGMHSLMNAAAATAAAAELGVEAEVSKETLEHFAGTWRRFEYKGEVNGAPVYDDYGHHPTEIRATLTAVRERFPDKRLVLVYQPHLGSRTEKLFDDFVEALSMADRLILTETYAARNQKTEGASSAELADTIRKKQENTAYIGDFDAVVAELKQSVSEKDIVLIMGAGGITEVAAKLVESDV